VSEETALEVLRVEVLRVEVPWLALFLNFPSPVSFQ
jgi:hypothetical protein